ncbi:MAG: DedA family protein [Chlorobi bacterium]|nr:DedA family protein [Chlorobiota bacterium]
MPGLEDIIQYMTHVDPGIVYLAIFAVAFIENIFPPFPSDVLAVFAGSLVALGQGDAVLACALGTGGSTLGFLAMYYIGFQFGERILEKGRIPFIPVELVEKVEHWFRKYGYWVIAANRFMAGTRAVVSFFAGLSEMNVLKTAILSAVSSALWYSILIYAGFVLGENWREIGDYLQTYSLVVTIVITVLILLFIVRQLIKKRKAG